MRDNDNPGKKDIKSTAGMERETKKNSRRKHLKIKKGADLKSVSVITFSLKHVLYTKITADVLRG